MSRYGATERSPASTMLFDEPHLRHLSVDLVCSLFQQAAQLGRQVIVSTQSAKLRHQFEPEDVVVVERKQGESVFRRLDSTQLSGWLDDYTLGDLWQKNVLGGDHGMKRYPCFQMRDGEAGADPQKEESGAGDKRP